MITQPAKVIETFDSYCLVETIPKSACPRCAEGKGCGGGILAQAFANKTYRIEVPYTSTLDNTSISQPSKGTAVLLSMSSNGLLLASMVMYLLPLVLMVLCSLMISIYISNSDFYTVLGAVIGLLFGALLASRLSRILINSGVTQAYMIEQQQSNCWYPAP